MRACLVLDAWPDRTEATFVRLDPQPAVVHIVTLDPSRRLNELHATEAGDLDLFLHRFPHAPEGTPEVDPAPNPQALAAAGALEPEDTAARLAVWQAAGSRWAEHPQVAVYDDAWFRALPAAAKAYAIPPGFAAEHGIERKGRHGPSHRLAAEQTGAERVVSVVLGRDSSVAAVVGGQPVEVSAGATALEGIPGGTTCGDVDSAVVLYLVDVLKHPVEDVERMLAREGGLAGVSRGRSRLGELRAAGDADAELALKLLAHRVKRYIGEYAAVMGGLDALVFSAAPRELDEALTARLTAGLDYLGVGGRVPVLTTELTPALAAATIA